MSFRHFLFRVSVCIHCQSNNSSSVVSYDNQNVLYILLYYHFSNFHSILKIMGRGSLKSAERTGPSPAVDTNFSINTDNSTLQLPLPSLPSPSPPFSESEYTIFVKASPSPPLHHHRALNLCLTPNSSQDDSTIEPFYLGTPPPLPPSPPSLTLAIRTVTTFLPPPISEVEEQGTERSGKDFASFVDDCLASRNNLSTDGENHQEDDDDDDYHHHHGGIWHDRRTNSLVLSNSNNDEEVNDVDERLMQPNLMLDAPTGIMFMFDRILDCMDAPGGKIGLGEGCHRGRHWPASSLSHTLWMDGTARLLDDDDQSISTIDNLVLDHVDSRSFQSGVLDIDVAVPTISFRVDTHQLAKIRPPLEGNNSSDDTLCLFPCWDIDDIVKEAAAAKKKKKKEATVIETQVRPGGRSRTTTRGVAAVVPHATPLDNIMSNKTIPLNYASQRPRCRSIYVSDESWDVMETSPVQENNISTTNNRKRNLSAMDDDGNGGGEEVVDDDDDDDSLSNLLRGLDFDPPFDEVDELNEMNRIQPPDCASSYSSLTY
jgi:hypothetical protein